MLVPSNLHTEEEGKKVADSVMVMLADVIARKLANEILKSKEEPVK